MGMVVSDETINAFLKELTQDVVKPADFQAAFKRSGISELQFFNCDARRVGGPADSENLFRQPGGHYARRALGVFHAGQANGDHRGRGRARGQLRRRIDEPSDEELKAFFEKYKDQYPCPSSPEPGFREPQKIALQYFKADTRSSSPW